MSPFFIAFLSLLVVFLLLTLGICLLFLARHVMPSRSFLPSVGRPSNSRGLPEFLLLAATALTWYNVSSCWLAQTIFYPIYPDMAALSPQAFHAYGRAYLTRLHAIILPGGLMCVAWVLVLWVPRSGLRMWRIWAIVMLCVIFVAITPVPAGTQDDMYDYGFSPELYWRLMWSHSVRTVIFTVMGMLSLIAVRDLFATSSSITSQTRSDA
jgi:hypothetical protein